MISTCPSATLGLSYDINLPIATLGLFYDYSWRHGAQTVVTVRCQMIRR